jgi:hypothetical protein
MKDGKNPLMEEKDGRKAAKKSDEVPKETLIFHESRKTIVGHDPTSRSANKESQEARMNRPEPARTHPLLAQCFVKTLQD